MDYGNTVSTENIWETRYIIHVATQIKILLISHFDIDFIMERAW